MEKENKIHSKINEETFSQTLNHIFRKYQYSKFLASSIEHDRIEKILENYFYNANCEFLDIIPLEKREIYCISILVWIGSYSSERFKLDKYSTRDRIESELKVINNFENLLNRHLSNIIETKNSALSAFVFNYKIMQESLNLTKLLKNDLIEKNFTYFPKEEFIIEKRISKKELKDILIQISKKFKIKGYQSHINDLVSPINI